MKTCSKCKIEKKESDFHRAAKEKSGLKSACKACLLRDFEDYKKKNPETRKETIRAYGARNAAAINAKSSAWYFSNIDRAKKTRRNWSQLNSDKVRADVSAYQAANYAALKSAAILWRRNNRDAVNQKAARRRAFKVSATPKWAAHEKINEFYTSADALGMLTGISHQVDHIVPLNSRHVCGLHCEANLQILTAYENKSKSNRFWPDMPQI